MFNMGAFLSYVFIVSFTPGPNNIMAMANAGKYGFKETMKFNAGILTGFFVLLISSSYFNLFLYSMIPKVKVFMGVLGAAYMLYLAFKIMSSKERDSQDNGNEKSDYDKERKLNLYFTGLALQLINPKVILYSITVISNFIIPYYKSNTYLILFSILLSIVGFMSVTSWALFGSIFNKFLSRYQKQFNIIMGILLIYSAASVSGLI